MKIHVICHLFLILLSKSMQISFEHATQNMSILQQSGHIWMPGCMSSWQWSTMSILTGGGGDCVKFNMHNISCAICIMHTNMPICRHNIPTYHMHKKLQMCTSIMPTCHMHKKLQMCTSSMPTCIYICQPAICSTTWHHACTRCVCNIIYLLTESRHSTAASIQRRTFGTGYTEQGPTRRDS